MWERRISSAGLALIEAKDQDQRLIGIRLLLLWWTEEREEDHQRSVHPCVRNALIIVPGFDVSTAQLYVGCHAIDKLQVSQTVGGWFGPS